MPVTAEENSETDFYTDEYYISGADGLKDELPDSAHEFFEENGIDASDYNWVNGITPEGVLSHIFKFITKGLKTPFKIGAGIIGIILICAALKSGDAKSETQQTAIYAAAVASAAIITVPVFGTVSASVNALKGISVFMLSFIPIFAVIAAASGAAVTAASAGGLLIAAAEAVSYISSFAVMPLMGGYLALSISASVSPLVKNSGITETVKKLSFWILSFICSVFVGIIGIQTAVNSSADTLTSKTAKFIIGSAVPVAGGAISEALGTVTASLSLLKASVGIYGVAACAFTLLPLIIELLLWRAVLKLTSAAAELFSLSEISSLLKAIDSMLSILIAVLLLIGAVFIISLAAVVSAGKHQ